MRSMKALFAIALVGALWFGVALGVTSAIVVFSPCDECSEKTAVIQEMELDLKRLRNNAGRKGLTTIPVYDVNRGSFVERVPLIPTRRPLNRQEGQ